MMFGFEIQVMLRCLQWARPLSTSTPLDSLHTAVKKRFYKEVTLMPILPHLVVGVDSAEQRRLGGQPRPEEAQDPPGQPLQGATAFIQESQLRASGGERVPGTGRGQRVEGAEGHHPALTGGWGSSALHCALCTGGSSALRRQVHCVSHCVTSKTSIARCTSMPW